MNTLVSDIAQWISEASRNELLDKTQVIVEINQILADSPLADSAMVRKYDGLIAGAVFDYLTASALTKQIEANGQAIPWYLFDVRTIAGNTDAVQLIRSVSAVFEGVHFGVVVPSTEKRPDALKETLGQKVLIITADTLADVKTAIGGERFVMAVNVERAGDVATYVKENRTARTPHTDDRFAILNLTAIEDHVTDAGAAVVAAPVIAAAKDGKTATGFGFKPMDPALALIADALGGWTFIEIVKAPWEAALMLYRKLLQAVSTSA